MRDSGVTAKERSVVTSKLVHPIAVLFAVAGTCLAQAGELPLEIRVRAGEHARVETPVSLALEGIEIDTSLRLVDVTADGDAPVSAQIESTDPPQLTWILSGTTPAGGERTYRLEAGEAVGDETLNANNEGAAIIVHHDERPVLQYNVQHVAAPEGADARYGRSGHIHPLWTPAGVIVTDEFPPDHAHQSGIFRAFVKTEFEGRTPDFWNLAGGTGRVRSAGAEVISQGPVFCRVRTRHEHVDLSASPEKVALEETWDLCVWKSAGDANVFDLTSTIRCAGDSPLVLPEYHYGGMALRGARGWTPEHCRFLTSDDHSREDGNHARVRWCDLTGDSDGHTAGIAMLTHPDNFRFPEPIRIHPRMPYMVYAPSQLGPWSIEPGTPHVARYRFIAHDGEADAAEIERLWNDFAHPPVAEVR